MKTVMGVFDTTSQADMAFSELVDMGYDENDISVISKDAREERSEKVGPVQNAVKGGTAGAVTGGAIGGIAGLLMAAGTLALPGIGPLLVGGPLIAALGLTGGAATTAAGALTGAVAGGLLGIFTGMGLPESTAKVYEKRVGEGALVLSVDADDDAAGEAKDILEKNGATDVETVKGR